MNHNIVTSGAIKHILNTLVHIYFVYQSCTHIRFLYNSLFALFNSSLYTIHKTVAITMQISLMWGNYRDFYCSSYYFFLKPTGVQLENSLATLRTVTSHCGTLAAAKSSRHAAESTHLVLWLLRSLTLGKSPKWGEKTEQNKTKQKQQGGVDIWFQVSKVTLGSRRLLETLRVRG